VQFFGLKFCQGLASALIGWMAKRLRGWRHDKCLQDAVLKQDSFSNEIQQSCLATLLLNMWAKGNISATAIQQIAHCAILDGAQHEELGNLAKCGNFGQQPGNIARDLHATFMGEICLAPSCCTQVPVLDPKTSKEDHEDLHVFLPHLMFWSLMLHYAEEAAIMFAIDNNKLEAFWVAFRVQSAQNWLDIP